MKPTITPTIQPQPKVQAHQQNVSRILNGFGYDFMAQVERRGLDLDFLFGPPAPKAKKSVTLYVIKEDGVKSEVLMLDEHLIRILEKHNRLYLDGTIFYRYPETVEKQK